MGNEDNSQATVDDTEAAFAEMTGLLVTADDTHAEAVRMADQAEETFTAVANVLAALDETGVEEQRNQESR